MDFAQRRNLSQHGHPGSLAEPSFTSRAIVVEAAADMFAPYGAGSALGHISRTSRRVKVLDLVQKIGGSPRTVLRTFRFVVSI